MLSKWLTVKDIKDGDDWVIKFVVLDVSETST